MEYVNSDLSDKKYIAETFKNILKEFKIESQRDCETFDKLLKIIISTEIEIALKNHAAKPGK